MFLLFLSFLCFRFVSFNNSCRSSTGCPNPWRLVLPSSKFHYESLQCMLLFSNQVNSIPLTEIFKTFLIFKDEDIIQRQRQVRLHTICKIHLSYFFFTCPCCYLACTHPRSSLSKPYLRTPQHSVTTNKLP